MSDNMPLVLSFAFLANLCRRCEIMKDAADRFVKAVLYSTKLYMSVKRYVGM